MDKFNVSGAFLFALAQNFSGAPADMAASTRDPFMRVEQDDMEEVRNLENISRNFIARPERHDTRTPRRVPVESAFQQFGQESVEQAEDMMEREDSERFRTSRQEGANRREISLDGSALEEHRRVARQGYTPASLEHQRETGSKPGVNDEAGPSSHQLILRNSGADVAAAREDSARFRPSRREEALRREISLEYRGAIKNTEEREVQVMMRALQSSSSGGNVRRTHRETASQPATVETASQPATVETGSQPATEGGVTQSSLEKQLATGTKRVLLVIIGILLALLANVFITATFKQ